mgnify:CR=1 FL=1
MKNTIVFFGDSITDSSKTDFPPLGVGYVSMVAEDLENDGEHKEIAVINSGVNGNSIPDLRYRYKNDVVAHHPQTLLIKIGINDAYNDVCGGTTTENLQDFKKGYLKLIEDIFRDLPNIRILLITPYFITDSTSAPLYVRMCEYGDIVKQLALSFNLPVFDSQKIFDSAVKEMPAKSWAEDQIHPGPDGHRRLADGIFTFLKENLS